MDKLCFYKINRCSYITIINNSNLGLIRQFNNNTNKKILKIVDLLGKEVEFKKNEILIYLFEDGSTEKVFIME
jgi:hypothetical protein